MHCMISYILTRILLTHTPILTPKKNKKKYFFKNTDETEEIKTEQSEFSCYAFFFVFFVVNPNNSSSTEHHTHHPRNHLSTTDLISLHSNFICETHQTFIVFFWKRNICKLCIFSMICITHGRGNLFSFFYFNVTELCP